MSSRQRVRRHLRVPVRLRVRVHEQEGGESVYFTRNVSVGGLFLRMQPTPPVGTVMDLEILGEEPLSVRGRVLRTDDTGCAFEFVGLEPPMRIRLRKLVNALIDASVVAVSASSGSSSEKATTYWAKGAHTARVALVKLSEEGAQFEGLELPDLYDQIRVFLPLGAQTVEKAMSQCPAQVVNLHSRGFSVVFLERPPEFVEAVRTMLSPPNPSLH